MQKQSSGSVKVTFLNAEAVRGRVRQAVLELARQRPEVERVVLFGSLARGGAVPGSDADLLITLSSSDRPFLDRIPLYIPPGCSVPVDVFPYTAEECQTLLESGHSFLRRAIAEGILVYQRPEVDRIGGPFVE